LAIGLLVCACGGAGDDNCVPRADTYCIQGTTYWTDSCGNPTEILEQCQCGCTADHTVCETCEECIPQAQTSCSAGTVRWVDSCGTIGEVKETCECGCSVDGLGCDPACCQPDCEGKLCGPDGCGGQCLPGCGANERCDDGACIETREIGDPCTLHSQCGENGRCLVGDFPGGLCTRSGCSDSNPCPAGSGCFSFTDGSTACLKTCNQDSDCREAEGYICDSYNTCWPGCNTDEHCPADWICDTNTNECVEVGPECSLENPSGYCPPGLVCTDGVCEEFECNDTLLEPNETQQDAIPLPAADTTGFQICEADVD
jgi:hypothetical protein